MALSFPTTITGATLLDRSTPRAGSTHDAVILLGETEATSGYCLRVGQELLVASDKPEEPFIARVGKIVYTPSESPPWTFKCQWFYRLKEVAVDVVRKSATKVRVSGWIFC